MRWGASYTLITKICTSPLTGALFPYDYLAVEGAGLQTVELVMHPSVTVKAFVQTVLSNTGIKVLERRKEVKREDVWCLY